ncbi:MAG: hypothetical protein SchgKO_04860 [Schleiferiaceae bacterium]
MKKLITLTAVLCLCFSQLNGQSSARGYLGKKNLTSYTLGYTLFNYPNSSYNLEFVHRLKQEIVVSQKSSLAGLLEYRHTQGQYFNPESPTSYTASKDFNILEVGFRYVYSKRLNSPVGPYREVGISYAHSMVSFDENEFIAEDPSEVWMQESASTSGAAFKFSYGWGYRRMVSNSVFLQYGIEFAYAYNLSSNKDVPQNATNTKQNFLDQNSFYAGQIASGFSGVFKIAIGGIY